MEIAPGSVIVVRDEEWLVSSIDNTDDGPLYHVQGLSELVQGVSASFYGSLDKITAREPGDLVLIGDDSPAYRRSRLWLDATIRKTPVPIADPEPAVADKMLATPLVYQQTAVRRALDPDNLRPRILLADAVGLGKTLEIGFILAELARRGRADRVLIVTPRHVLEQMQHELWTRFALPFVRLDSVGIQRIRQELPATRNPFSYFQRVIISIDTLKQERFAQNLRRHHWDAVVIDESHNITNSATQNNQLARTLAPNTDALILASATPHNGTRESFAELIRLLEPTAVTPDGELNADEVKRIVVRRHRHSPEVAEVVGADWAQRKEPRHLLVDAAPAEGAVAEELERTWLYPDSGRSPYSGRTGTLFPWTLAKAFLSSPAALQETLANRRSRLGEGAAAREEGEALDRLDELNSACLRTPDGKFSRLVDHLAEIRVCPGSDRRAVIFAERVATLTWLRERLLHELRFDRDAVVVLHGGLSDVEQQQVIDSFKQATSPIRLFDHRRHRLRGRQPARRVRCPKRSIRPLRCSILGLYDRDVDFLRDALEEIYGDPTADPRGDGGGVRWREFPQHGLVQLIPPADLRQRLRVLPQSYLRDRRVDRELKLAVTPERGEAALADALTDSSDSTWPEAHFLGPLHPVLDWAADRALAVLSRQELFVVRAEVDQPTFVLYGTLTNRRGQVVAASFLTVEFPNPANPSFALVTPYPSIAALAEVTGLDRRRHNPGPVRDVVLLQTLLRPAVREATQQCPWRKSPDTGSISGSRLPGPRSRNVGATAR